MNKIIAALRGALDALEYVDHIAPKLVGWGARAQHMSDIKAAIVEAEASATVTAGAARQGGNTSAESPATPSAGTIDTPEFRRLVAATDFHTIHSKGYETDLAALITHIMDWHSAGVAAEKERINELTIAAQNWHAHWLSRGELIAELKAALAAAREQALEEAAQACEKFGKGYDNEINRSMGSLAQDLKDVADECVEQIRALASQPATTRQTDEVTDELSVDRETFEQFWAREYMAGEPEDRLKYRNSSVEEIARASFEAGTRSAAAAPVAQAPVVQDGAIRAKIAEALYFHRLSNAVCGDDPSQNYPLVDMLTPDGETIAEGRNEIDRIVDAVMEVIAAPTPVAAPVLTDAAKRLAEQVRSRLEQIKHIAEDYDVRSFAKDALVCINAILATQAERQPQPATAGWVSVEERLPVEDGWYAVMVSDPHDIGWETGVWWRARYDAEQQDWGSCDSVDDGQPVTHWRAIELPSVPAATPPQQDQQAGKDGADHG